MMSAFTLQCVLTGVTLVKLFVSRLSSSNCDKIIKNARSKIDGKLPLINILR